MQRLKWLAMVILMWPFLVGGFLGGLGHIGGKVGYKYALDVLTYLATRKRRI